MFPIGFLLTRILFQRNNKRRCTKLLPTSPFVLWLKSECRHSSQPHSWKRSQNGSSGPRRFCGVNSERSGELRRGGFADPEHSNAEGWSRLAGGGTPKKKHLLSRCFFFGTPEAEAKNGVPGARRAAAGPFPRRRVQGTKPDWHQRQH